ncbi:hypothetical protein [Lonepinella sp. BR2474]|uniref:hypothetical protein n=1 Tax=Lonepinella sp. BR2474 TaxID=3434548 RepID=UPI003F6DAFFA
MKKSVLWLALPMLLSSCAEASQFLTSALKDSKMPDYETYEKLATSNNSVEFEQYFKRQYTDDWPNLKLDVNLVNSDIFSWYNKELFSDKNRYSEVIGSVDTDDKTRPTLNLKFSSVLNFTRTNFYKLLELSPNDVKIEILKQICYEYRYSALFYKLTLKSGKNLYLVEDSGSGNASAQTSLKFSKKKLSCDSVGYEERGKISKETIQFFEQ